VEVDPAANPRAAVGTTSRALGGFEACKAVEALVVEAVDEGEAATQLGDLKLATGDESVSEDATVMVGGVAAVS
jgi:hypothetical protein